MRALGGRVVNKVDMGSKVAGWDPALVWTARANVRNEPNRRVNGINIHP